MSPTRYRVVVEGELGPRFAAAFEGMTVRAHNGKTEIVGAIIDSSHLHGMLARIASLGLQLHSLNPLETRVPDAGEYTQPDGRRDDVPRARPEDSVRA